MYRQVCILTAIQQDDIYRNHWVRFIVIILFCVGYSISVDCPAGFEYKSESHSCEECEIGFFKQNTRDVACLPCPEGYVTLDTASVDISACSVPIKDTGRCAPGLYWISIRESCIPCGLGTYRAGGSDYLCLLCPPNTSTTGIATISKQHCLGRCGVGRHWNPDSKLCVPCPVGSYSESDDYQPCLSCPNSQQTTFSEGAGSRTACYEDTSPEEGFLKGDCPLGTTWSEESHSCVICPVNTHMDVNSTQCVDCPLATYTIQFGATHRALCMGWQQIDDIHQFQKLSEYVACPLGMETSFSPQGCSPCPQGTYRDSQSQPHCELCGEEIQALCGNNGAAVSCPVGTEWLPNVRVCSLCPVGTYKSLTSTAKCAKCTAGKTTSHPGATSENFCTIPLSRHSPEFAYFTKADCPIGSEWDESVSGCRACPVSFYRDRTSRHCKPCGAGYSTQSTGSVSLSQCVVPIQDSVYSITEAGCPPGMEPGELASLCQGCPDGTYKETSGFHSCTTCPVNTSGLTASSSHSFATSETHCQVSVLVKEVTPVKFLMTGGSQLTATLYTNASHLRIHSVFVAGVLCHLNQHLITNGSLSCIMGHYRAPASGPVTVYLIHGDSAVRTHSSSQNIQVVRNPKVVEVSRRRFFLSGGVDVDIEVEHVRDISKVKTIWYTGSDDVTSPSEITECSASSSSSIKCKVPRMTDHMAFAKDDDHRKRRDVKSGSDTEITRTITDKSSAKFRRDVESDYENGAPVFMGLKFDGWEFYRNLTDVGLINTSVKFFNDPVLHNLPGHPEVVNTVISDINLVVTFQGSHLSAGCLLEDYVIHIGDELCRATRLTNTQVTCSVTREQFRSFKNAILYATKVVIGNLHYTPGYIRVVHHPTQTTEKPSNAMEPKDLEHSDAAQQKTRSGSNENKMLQIILPTIAGLAVLAILIAVLLYMLLHKKRSTNCGKEPPVYQAGSNSQASTWDPTLQNIEEIEHINQAALPPLPVISVFGPSRITDRGVTMRQLALPENNFSSDSVCS